MDRKQYESIVEILKVMRTDIFFGRLLNLIFLVLLILIVLFK